MKTFLVAAGFSLAAFTVLIEINSRRKPALPPGLLWVSVASIVSAALWSVPKRHKDHAHYAIRVYAALAEKPLPLKSLLEEITGDCFGEDAKAIAKAVIVTMLEEGSIIISAGLVSISLLRAPSA